MPDNTDAKPLSSRVLNMKFMRKAEEINVEDEKKSNSKKLKDQSEWTLPSLSAQAKLKLLNKPKIKKVGYSVLMEDELKAASSDLSSGRKKWGEPENPDPEAEVDGDTPSSKQTKSQKESKEFLNKLWTKQKQEDDDILDSLSNGISGAGSSSGNGTKRKYEGNGNSKFKKSKR